MINDSWFNGLTSRALGDGLIWKNKILPNLNKKITDKAELFRFIEDLTSLDCCNCKGKYGEDLISLCGLEHSILLEELYCANNRIEDINDISNCTKLSILDLSNNLINNIDNISNLPLTELYLSTNQLNYLDFKHWKFPEKLKVLVISNNRLKRIKGLENLRNLEVLDLSNNSLIEISDLESLKYLKELDLSNNSKLEGTYNSKTIKCLDLRNTLFNEIKSKLSREDEELAFLIKQMRQRKYKDTEETY